MEDVEGEGGGGLGPRSEPGHPSDTSGGSKIGHEPPGSRGEEADSPVTPPQPQLHVDRGSEQPVENPQEEPIFPVYDGRVPTPDLQDGVTRPRHHLDLTTPVVGGVLTSPVKLPYPPTSPKYRKDMKSVAPIFPSPMPRTTELALRKSQLNSGSTQHQVSSSLSHSTHHTRWHPPRTSSPNVTEDGAVRQLRFDTRKAHTQGNQTAGVRATHMETCDTCGSRLRPPASRPGQTVGLSRNPRERLQPLRQDWRHKSGVTYMPPSTTQVAGPHRVYRPSYTTARLAHSAHTALSTQKEYTPLPANTGRERDIDQLSLSSCSDASDLLRRAQERRDYFWTRPLES